MDIRQLTGYYTYRSFVNEPRSIDDLNKIRFGEGELFLSIQTDGSITGTLSFPAEQGHLQKAFMDIVEGTVNVSGDQIKLEFMAQGRPNTNISDWQYAYNCSVANIWKTGDKNQRLALVGTVIRVQDHSSGQAKAGFTASFISVIRDFVEPQDISQVALIPDALKMVSSRSHRLIHVVWHLLRGIVEVPEDSGRFVVTWYLVTKDKESEKKIRELGWHLPRPPLSEQRTLILDNGAGEDFLYMHRKMIAMIRQEYESKGIPYIQSWKTASLPTWNIPQFVYSEKDDPANPGKKIFVIEPSECGNMLPLPPIDLKNENNNDINFLKTSEFYRNVLRPLAGIFSSPTYLATLTLGALGNLIEFTIHNWMHVRWASPTGAYLRNPETGEIVKDSEGKPIERKTFDFDPRWDHPFYDYLGEPYSSHVNPLFWRLHGWVDDRIEDWFNAHQAVRPGEVERSDLNGVSWFKKGNWVMVDNPFYWPEDQQHHHDHKNNEDMIIENIEKVIDIIKALIKQNSIPETRTLHKNKKLSLPGGSLNFINTSDVENLSTLSSSG